MVLYINTKDKKTVSVALKEGRKIFDEIEDHNGYGSQILLPIIIKILKKHKFKFKDLTGIEVEEGPGSFTGIRVGASVAQALGYALGVKVNGSINKPVNVRYT